MMEGVPALPLYLRHDSTEGRLFSNSLKELGLEHLWRWFGELRTDVHRWYGIRKTHLLHRGTSTHQSEWICYISRTICKIQSDLVIFEDIDVSTYFLNICMSERKYWGFKKLSHLLKRKVNQWIKYNLIEKEDVLARTEEKWLIASETGVWLNGERTS
jgi:hypothetical protein